MHILIYSTTVTNNIKQKRINLCILVIIPNTFIKLCVEITDILCKQMKYSLRNNC